MPIFAALLNADGQPAVWVEPVLSALALAILSLIGWAALNLRTRIAKEAKDEDKVKGLHERINDLSHSVEKLVDNRIEHAMMEVALGRQQCRSEVDGHIADTSRHNDLVVQEVTQLHEAIDELKSLVVSTQRDIGRLTNTLAMYRTQSGNFRFRADEEEEDPNKK